MTKKNESNIPHLPPLPCKALMTRDYKTGPDAWVASTQEILVWSYIPEGGALISICDKVQVINNINLLKAIPQ